MACGANRFEISEGGASLRVRVYSTAANHDRIPFDTVALFEPHSSPEYTNVRINDMGPEWEQYGGWVGAERQHGGWMGANKQHGGWVGTDKQNGGWTGANKQHGG